MIVNGKGIFLNCEQREGKNNKYYLVRIIDGNEVMVMISNSDVKIKEYTKIEIVFEIKANRMNRIIEVKEE